MKTLHFFTEYYYPASNSTSYYITRIIHACAREWEGKVNVFCATENKGEEILLGKNIHIKRLPEGKINKNVLAKRILKFIILTIRFGWIAILNIKKNDTVFAVTNPAFLLVFLAALRILVKFRFVLLVYDIFPEVLIPSGLKKENSFQYKLSLKIFNWAYDKADVLIVIGRDMEEIVKKKVKKAEKIVYIPNWSDAKHLQHIEKKDNPILKRLGIENHFIFSVAGNMGRTQGLESIVCALSKKKLPDNVSFIFMGDGAKLCQIKELAQNNDSIKITGRIPDEEQDAMLNACDIAVVSLAKGMYGLSVPSKSYFNMAAEKPILLIGDKRSEIGRVIDEHKIGWIVEPGNIEQFNQTIDLILTTEQKKINELGKRARKVAMDCYDTDVILKQFIATICGEKYETVIKDGIQLQLLQ